MLSVTTNTHLRRQTGRVAQHLIKQMNKYGWDCDSRLSLLSTRIGVSGFWSYWQLNWSPGFIAQPGTSSLRHFAATVCPLGNVLESRSPDVRVFINLQWSSEEDLEHRQLPSNTAGNGLLLTRASILRRNGELEIGNQQDWTAAWSPWQQGHTMTALDNFNNKKNPYNSP